MIAFIRGSVYSFGNDYVIMDTGSIGYRVYVAKPQAITKKDEIILYTYQHIREDAQVLYGFLTMEEHDLFLRLISVKGVGPRTALGMLAMSSAKEMIQAIEQNDVKFMKSLPGIGAKTASQIVLDLKGKLVEPESEQAPSEHAEINEAMDALKGLGYKQAELQGIAKELTTIKADGVQAYIRHALSILAKRKGV
ncbi:MAG: Holliday junction branch migration protein RuvA [Erysipelotrichaceae bacterium]|nr:Holliday junction branch migration protein RuvA [Erysipelotrichaceae bacterium]MCI9312092.1 Holliday junction branch migration protein RuvA [Erysipelotrichaceae bacterium]